MGYDVKCYDLAQAFIDGDTLRLSAREKAIERLAQEIQNTIDAFMEYDLKEDASWGSRHDVHIENPGK